MTTTAARSPRLEFPEGLRPSLGPLTILVGPPGSGKLALIEREAASTDLVIDERRICEQLAGQPYAPGWDDLVLHRRNALLRGLSVRPARAWMTVEQDGQAVLDWWCRQLRPSRVIRMETDTATCIERIRADLSRPATVVVAHVQAARRWGSVDSGVRYV